MEYTIYGDVLIAVNFIVNVILLKASAAVARIRPKSRRLYIAAAVGAVCSLAILIPASSAVFDILVRLTVSMTVVAIAFGELRDKAFFKVYAVFFGVSFMAAGVVAGLMCFFPSGGFFYKNGTLYLHISPLVLIICVAAAYAVSGLFNRVACSRSDSCDGVYDLTIARGGRQVRVRALADTGNRLTERFSGWPVVVVSCESVYALLSEKERRYAATDRLDADMPATLRLVAYESAGGGGVYKAFRPDSITIITPSGAVDLSGYVAVCHDGFGGEYKAVFNPRLIQAVL